MQYNLSHINYTMKLFTLCTNLHSKLYFSLNNYNKRRLCNNTINLKLLCIVQLFVFENVIIIRV